MVNKKYFIITFCIFLFTFVIFLVPFVLNNANHVSAMFCPGIICGNKPPYACCTAGQSCVAGQCVGSSYCKNDTCVNTPQPPPAGYTACTTVGAHCCSSPQTECKPGPLTQVNPVSVCCDPYTNCYTKTINLFNGDPFSDYGACCPSLGANGEYSDRKSVV